MAKIRARYGQPAIYNASTPTLVDGDDAALQVDSSGNVKTNLATNIAGEDIVADVQKVEQRFGYNNITTATTTVVKSGVGLLHGIIINTPVASATITIYDNTAASGTKIGTITLGGTLANDVGTTYLYDVSFSVGLTIVTSGATDITISYR